MTNKKNRTAYSLIELSIILTVIAILVTGATSVSINSLNNQKIKLTRERIDKAYEMIKNNTKVNKRLPCPAPLNVAKSSSNYGDYSGGCAAANVSGNYVWGMLPVKSLGYSSEYAEDGFGNKLIYFIDSRFSNFPDESSPPNFSNSNQNNFSTMLYDQVAASGAPLTSFTIQINPNGTRQAIAGTGSGGIEPAVMGIISLGPNKFGAYNTNSTTANSSSGAGADELVNLNPGGGIIISSSQGDTVFDDIVLYKSARSLIVDFGINDLVPCKNSDLSPIAGGLYNSYFDTSGTNNNAWFDGITYSKKVGAGNCASNANLRYSFKCGPLGKWLPIVNSCVASGSGCTLTQNTNQGSGAYYTGATTSFSTGTVALTCRSGYGRKIIGGSRTSTNTTQTCGITTTDRSNDTPLAFCSGGTVRVLNDCSQCRGCSSTSPTSGNDSTIYSASKMCNTNSWCVNNCAVSDSMLGYCSFNITHNTTYYIGIVRKRKCYVFPDGCSNHPQNVCLAFTTTCNDGILNVVNGYNVSISNSGTACPAQYNTCRSYSVSDNC